MIEVFARRNSSNAQPVMWTLGELDLPHRRHDVGGSFGGTDTSEYRAMNPNGLVPTIRDGDLVLWESNAIVRYLCRQYDTAHILLPETNETYALADQWMDWHRSKLNPALMGLFWSIVRTEPALRNETEIERLRKQTVSALAILDDRLASAPFVAGERLTMADLPLGSLVYRYLNLDIDRPRFPGIEAWYERLCARPAYREHVMLRFGTCPAEWYRFEREPV